MLILEAGLAGVSGLVANAPVRLEGILVGRHLMPMTITEPKGQAQSWVVSLRTAYGPYAHQELAALPLSVSRPILAALIGCFDRQLVSANLDQLVCVNNWLLSTNLYPDWDGSGLDDLIHRLTANYPAHFIAFRSLNTRHHAGLLKQFHDAGWSLLPSRQVWIVEPDGAPTRDRGNDARLLARTSLARAYGDQFDDTDWERTADLYGQLYLGKYSSLNPVFAPRFLAWAHRSGFMRVEGLREDGGRLLAVVGTIASNGVMTTPLVGYEMAAPRKLGLYRMITAMAFEDMNRRGASFNLSAGVGAFKRNRGARPAIEYTALWSRHLPPARRLPPALLCRLLRGVGVPLMSRYGL